MNNFEIYEKATKKKPSSETVKLNKQEKLKEEKEKREKEIKLTRGFCADYHTELDKTSYFDDRAMKKAKDLLPKFQSINLKLLPEALQNVVKHRMAYLKLMVDLAKNKKFKKVIAEFAPKATDLGLLSGNYNAIKEKASKSKVFRSLTLDDYKESLAALRMANKSLKEVIKPKNGRWDKAAKLLLMPPNERGKKDSRVDDLKSAQNLQDGIDKLIKNISRLRREREVLRKTSS